VLQARQTLEKSKIYVGDDYPSEIVIRRKKLWPIFKAAKAMDRYKGRCKLIGDKLILNGTSYTVNNLSSLPKDLDPRLLSTVTNNGVCVFFGNSSPLSNHHPSPFVVDKVTYTCVEQYLMSEKAALFHNSEIAEDIMKMSDPVQMKRAAHWKLIKGFNDHTWHNTAPDILKRALHAKFAQNKPLLDFLISTRQATLGEACDDPFWGVGMRLGNPNVCRATLWKNNLMGKTLQTIRTELR
jgi:ribA/ribD-fused uncharacterized protein